VAILVAGALLAAGLGASLIAGRLRVPALVLFLGLGMLVGSDGLGWIDFSNYALARDIGVVALALILFEGGLNAGFDEIRPVLGPSIALAFAGTALTAAITGLVAAALFGFSTKEGLLVGSIIAATDGAAIFALLRESTLRRKLARTLEGEAGLNDAVAVLLVLACIDWLLKPGYDADDALLLLVRQFGLGIAAGAAAGWLGVQALQRVRLATAGLYPVASLAIAGVAYGAAAALEGSGFVAVYLAGLALGSARIPARQTVANFHQGLGWLAQLSMFLVLGLLVFPSQLGGVAVEGTALALVLVLVARPLAVVGATVFARYSAAERLMLGWAGLRGAVPVVLATFPVLDHVPGSLEFFNIVFFAVVVSTVLQGTTFEPLAKRLGVTTTDPALPPPLMEAGTVRRLGAEVLEYSIKPDDAIVGARVRDLGLPREAVVNVVVRGEEAIPPRGSTRLRAGDRLNVLIRQEATREVPALVDRWRTGPIGPPRRPPKRLRARPATLTVRPWTDDGEDRSRPRRVGGEEVVDLLRIRRDHPGALVVLRDGRYAITSPLLAVGGREDLTGWLRRRVRHADDAELAWLQTVIGALAADLYDRPA
jgi:cell volume regulation protein A